jgi:hypothetical protein
VQILAFSIRFSKLQIELIGAYILLIFGSKEELPEGESLRLNEPI